ncbi:hypothetical protein POM88_023514 [Heracleum sosnowskyi]|uniref:Uncharacterized protein n=1 Tax=Heracleum sosnowskyi TaxID=360622 RepID=A0AAD8IH70_9APIA|nr:hypothetical protein POM88_023514 [Heracleum sosnowskyi]
MEMAVKLLQGSTGEHEVLLCQRMILMSHLPPEGKCRYLACKHLSSSDCQHLDQVKAKIEANDQKSKVTGLAYSSALNILVSSGKCKINICSWRNFAFMKQSSRFLDIDGRDVSQRRTCFKFHQNQSIFWFSTKAVWPLLRDLTLSPAPSGFLEDGFVMLHIGVTATLYMQSTYL